MEGVPGGTALINVLSVRLVDVVINKGEPKHNPLKLHWIVPVLIAAAVVVLVLYLLTRTPVPPDGPPSQPQANPAMIVQNALPNSTAQPANTPMKDAVRDWREAAWQRDDVFAQLKLGHIYAHDESFGDPVEAYVWYFIALDTGHDFREETARSRQAMNELLDDAYDDQDDVYRTLTPDQQVEARNRIIYVLSCRGAEGFITLGNLHRDQRDQPALAPRPSPPQPGWLDRLFGSDANQPAAPALASGYAPSDPTLLSPGSTPIMVSSPESLLYYYLAQKAGHPLADAYVESEREIVYGLHNGASLAADAADRADNWTRPFEYYPGETRGGTLHSDECMLSRDEQLALPGVSQIAPRFIGRALWIIGVAASPSIEPDPQQPGDAVRAFQDIIGDEETGVLTPEEIVRAMRMGAVAGDATLQNELGVMYAKGRGVPRNFVRAKFWFEKAAEQRCAEALFNLSVLYKKGPNGVGPDDYKSSVLVIDSARAGFSPTLAQLRKILGEGHSRQSGISRERR